MTGPCRQVITGRSARCLQAAVMHSQLAIPAYDRCVSGTFRLEGLFVLAVAVAVPALTAMLSLIAPGMTRRRLARSGGFASRTRPRGSRSCMTKPGSLGGDVPGCSSAGQGSGRPARRVFPGDAR